MSDEKKKLPILVVDDEQSMRELLSIMLKKHGHAVVTAPSGKDAIELFAPHVFQLVVTDMKMPGGKTGLDVVQHVKEVDPACQVVVMTA